MTGLPKLKLRGQILAGFALVILVAGVIAAQGIWGLRDLERSFDTYAELGDDAALVSDLRGDIVKTMLGVRTWLRTEDAATKQEVIDLETTVEDGIAQAQQVITDPERAAKVDGIDAAMQRFHAGFDRIVDLVDRRNAFVRAGMDEIGPDIRQRLTEISEGAYADGDFASASEAALANQHLLLGRLYAAKFLLDNQPADAERVGAEFEQLSGRIDTLSDETIEAGIQNRARQAQLGDVRELIPKYRDAFAGAQDAIVERNDLIQNVIVADGRIVESGADAIQASVSADEKALQEATHGTTNTTQTLMLMVAVGGLALGALAAWLIGGKISWGVRRITDAMSRLAQGERDTEVPGRGRADEIGEMAEALAVFKTTAQQQLDLAEQQKADAQKEAQEAERVRQATERFRAEVGELLETLGAASTELESTAGAMSAAASQTSQQTETVASASDQASANTQTVAASTEELSTSIAEVTQQIEKTAGVADRADTQARAAMSNVQEVRSGADAVTKVVELIKDIAEQTNLLALNATIEAARAGEAGKGFAVVANEVKNLATQTTKATEEVGQQIEQMRESVGRAVPAMEQVAEIVREMNEIAGVVASTATEQAAATDEITRNVQQAAAGAQEVAGNVGGLREGAQSTSAGAEQVLSTAGDVARQATDLRTAIDRYVEQVAAWRADIAGAPSRPPG
ncbi:MAG: methyl-accepting chemotaxis protein [Rhodovibrio sp.]|nr:methyl-accepting chemotaxis protein [Rhodovibrio sp.]